MKRANPFAQHIEAISMSMHTWKVVVLVAACIVSMQTRSYAELFDLTFKYKPSAPGSVEYVLMDSVPITFDPGQFDQNYSFTFTPTGAAGPIRGHVYVNAFDNEWDVIFGFNDLLYHSGAVDLGIVTVEITGTPIYGFSYDHSSQWVPATATFPTPDSIVIQANYGVMASGGQEGSITYVQSVHVPEASTVTMMSLFGIGTIGLYWRRRSV